MGLLTRFLSKDFPSTAAALAMGRIAPDSEGLGGEGVFTADTAGGVVVAEASWALRVAASSALRSSFWRWSE